MYFPLAIDTFPTVAGSSSVADISHAGLHNSLATAIGSLETKVGITGSSDVNSLDYKINHLVVPTASGSITFAASAALSPSIVNLTTQGTIDWYLPNGNATPAKLLNSNQYHSKAFGGNLIACNWDWVFGGTACLFFTGVFTNPSVSASAMDNACQYVVSNQVGSQGISCSNSTDPGFGYKFSVPACITPQVLRIYSKCSNCTSNCSAFLTDGSAGTVTQSFSTGERYFKITFSSKGGGMLNVQVAASSITGSTPTIAFSAITLGYT